MRRLSLALTLVVTALGGACGAKTKPPIALTTRPATGAAGLSARTRSLLDQLEKAGREYPAIRADIDYKVVNPKLGDSESRTGWIAYQRGGQKQPARFRVHFDTLRQGEGRTVKDQLDYAFDGRWLTVVKHRIKQIARYEIVAEGEKAQPLKLGKGPFPLPFGQEADDVIKFFLPTTRPLGPLGPGPGALRDGEPKDTDYLKLVPRPQYRRRMSFTRLEMWVSRKRFLPVKIISRDHSKNITTVVFKNIKTPKSFPADMFRLPRKAGWTYTEKPLEPPKSK